MQKVKTIATKFLLLGLSMSQLLLVKMTQYKKIGQISSFLYIIQGVFNRSIIQRGYGRWCYRLTFFFFQVVANESEICIVCHTWSFLSSLLISYATLYVSLITITVQVISQLKYYHNCQKGCQIMSKLTKVRTSENYIKAFKTNNIKIIKHDITTF